MIFPNAYNNRFSSHQNAHAKKVAITVKEKKNQKKSLTKNYNCREIVISTTTIVVMLSLYVLGGLSHGLVQYLDIPTNVSVPVVAQQVDCYIYYAFISYQYLSLALI